MSPTTPSFRLFSIISWIFLPNWVHAFQPTVSHVVQRKNVGPPVNYSSRSFLSSLRTSLFLKDIHQQQQEQQERISDVQNFENMEVTTPRKERRKRTTAGNDAPKKNTSIKKYSKSNLPSKVCVVCNRPFEWRKKWADCWDEVKYCSNRCRGERSSTREK